MKFDLNLEQDDSLITVENIKDVLDYFKSFRVDKKRYEDLQKIFISGIPAEIEVEDVVQLIKIFIESEHKPVYINEVKEYLKKHDQETFKAYSDRFTSNPAIFEAFGFKPVSRAPACLKHEIKEFVTLRPVIIERKEHGSKQRSLKREIRDKNRQLAQEGIKAIREEKQNYKRKMEDAYAKIKKQN